MLLGGVSLVGTKEVVHIDIDVPVLEIVGRGCCAVGGIVRPIYGGGGVDYKGGGRVQGVEIVVISNHL